MIVGAYAWNVLVTAAISFAFGCVVFLLSRRRFFARRPRLLVFVLALPFAKLVIELVRGVPKGAFFWEQVHGVVPESGTFQIGLGVDRFGPVVNFLFGALNHGISRPQSAADGLARIVDRRLGAGASTTLGFVLLAVTALMVTREIRSLVRASLHCRRHARAGRVVERRRLGLRRVEVLLSPAWHGAPFAGGLVRPWICVSEAFWSELDLVEREAVLQHELAHLRWLDGVTLTGARVARSVVWFLPGAGAALRRLTTQCELSADADAVMRGASPEVLASALVRTGELVLREPAPLLPLARGERSVLVQRVHRLLDGEPPMAMRRWPVVVTVLLAIAVLRMTAFGNP